MNGFGGNEDLFLVSSDRDLVDLLIFIEWDVGYDVWTPLALTLPHGRGGLTGVSDG